MKAYKSGVQKLLEFLSVYEDEDRMNVEVSEVIDVLASIQSEIYIYVQDLVYKEEKGCECHLSFPDMNLEFPAEDGSFSGRELIYLPFMSCSVWLWKKLMQNPNNPIFETVRYCCMNVHYLRCKLSMYGVPYDKPLTSKLLREYNVIDIFEIYKYEHIFRDALQHLEGK